MTVAFVWQKWQSKISKSIFNVKMRVFETGPILIPLDDSNITFSSVANQQRKCIKISSKNYITYVFCGNNLRLQFIQFSIHFSMDIIDIDNPCSSVNQFLDCSHVIQAICMQGPTRSTSNQFLKISIYFVIIIFLLPSLGLGHLSQRRKVYSACLFSSMGILQMKINFHV